MKLDFNEAKAAYEDTGLLQDGWYAPVRITAAEEAEATTGTHGLKASFRFTKPNGKPMQRSFKIWHTGPDKPDGTRGETKRWGARVVFALAKHTEAVFDGDEGPEIDEVAMVGKYVALRVGTDRVSPDYPDPKNNIGEVLPSHKDAPYVFAGKKGELKTGQQAGGARAATQTMQAQSQQQEATQRARAQSGDPPADFEDDIPF